MKHWFVLGLFFLVSLACLACSQSRLHEDSVKPTEIITKSAAINGIQSSQSDGVEKDKLVTNSDSNARKDAKGDGVFLSSETVVGEEFITLPEFAVIIAPDEATREKLSTMNETMVVTAWFMVNLDPNEEVPESYKPFLDEDGLMEILVASKRLELKVGETRAEFRGIQYSRHLYDTLRAKDRNIRMGLNVTSGYRAADVNLLDCEILSGAMSEVGGKEFEVLCKLL